MFGGATSYVETLDEVLAFVADHRPPTDELVGWHRGAFEQVSSSDSIMHRVRYLENVGFLADEDGRWTLGPEGRRYFSERTTEQLLEIMARRNVGLRSLLYALSAGPMTIEEIGSQQLATHPELAWDPSETDMAHQRANWLRSLGLVRKTGEEYELTDDGRRFTDEAVAQWTEADAATSATPPDEPQMVAPGTYETVVEARSLDPEFRATVLSRYDTTCPVSGVDHAALLDVAHVLPWSDHPEFRADLGNVLALNRTHHAAFDRGLFTIDADYRLRVNPSFSTESDLLRRTIAERAGESVAFPEHGPAPEYLERHNATLGWSPG